MIQFATILADPPWPQKLMGRRNRPRDPHNARSLPYSTMGLEEIRALPIATISEPGTHLWLWTTNQFLRQGFEVMEAWGFRYLAPIHWIKPSGAGNYFIHRTQTLLFGYKDLCRFPLERYKANLIFAKPGIHSQKPDAAYELIESISPSPRVELFARIRRENWSAWGDEIESDIAL